MSEMLANALGRNPYVSAVQQAKALYPALAPYPITLTSNLNRVGNSETYSPTEGENPVPGKWNVEMWKGPYAQNQASWPELIGLEGLHILQQEDPRYRQLTQQLAGMLTGHQRADADRMYARDQKLFNVTEPKESFLQHVFVPEFIRDQLWGDYFKKYEGGPGANERTADFTPEERSQIANIAAYMRKLR